MNARRLQQRGSQPAQFDYVIAGAGSAGCVLANRLSSDPAKTVCLIEAGPRDSSPLIHVPLGIMALIEHKKLNWRFQTVPQAHAGNRQIYVPRGRVLGGSSSINGMVYVRGYPEDYDDWANAGNHGWAYRDVLPYFLRSEDNERWLNSPYHGVGGPLHVAEMRARNPASDSFLEATHLFQIPPCEDFNGVRPEGSGYRQVTQNNGQRESTATAFLKPALNRPNLTVFTECLIDTISFEGKIARGVNLLRDGQQIQILANKEVILAAGVIGSPEILLRSGVGEPENSRELGIDVVHALPGVGKNLHDQCAATLMCETRSTIPYGISFGAIPRLMQSGMNYILNRRGMLASTGAEVAAFLRSSPELPRTDLQLTFLPGKRGAKLISYGHGYALVVANVRPASRGEIRLSDRSPHSAPAIDPRFFEDEGDLQVLIKGVQLSRQILNSAPFARYGGTEMLPGPAVNSEQEFSDFIRNNSSTVYHPVGTCAMGSGPNAVVDDQLRVRGIEGLRVVDASIMPTIIGGNTNAPTIMIAEKASDLILERTPPPAIDWHNFPDQTQS